MDSITEINSEQKGFRIFLLLLSYILFLYYTIDHTKLDK